jgi:hypothetical protein
LPKNNRSIRFPLHCAGCHAPHKRCCSKGTSTVDPRFRWNRWGKVASNPAYHDNFIIIDCWCMINNMLMA